MSGFVLDHRHPIDDVDAILHSWAAWQRSSDIAEILALWYKRRDSTIPACSNYAAGENDPDLVAERYAAMQMAIVDVCIDDLRRPDPVSYWAIYKAHDLGHMGMIAMMRLSLRDAYERARNALRPRLIERGVIMTEAMQ